MKRKFDLKKLLLIIGIVLLAIQSIRIDKTTKPLNTTTDFITSTMANETISHTLKIACYDCHSNQATYPWYSHIAPISWWIKNHINEGSLHLNFSDWATYSEKKRNHKLEECIELVEEGEMPMYSYTVMHKEAKLTDAQKLELVEYFKSMKNQ